MHQDSPYIVEKSEVTGLVAIHAAASISALAYFTIAQSLSCAAATVWAGRERGSSVINGTRGISPIGIHDARYASSSSRFNCHIRKISLCDNVDSATEGLCAPHFEHYCRQQRSILVAVIPKTECIQSLRVD
jgi:hypothetical protein